MKNTLPSSTKSKYLPLLSLTIKTAILAGKAILNTKHHGYKTAFKRDKSPVTEADQRSHQLISDLLLDHVDRFPLLTEEGAKIPYSRRKHWKKFWLVDPLDGTKEFIKNSAEYTVNIALIYLGKPVLGVIYAPELDVLYFASHRFGAYKKERAAKVTDLSRLLIHSRRIRFRKSPTRSIRVIASHSHFTAATKDYLGASSQKIDLLRVGSSLKFGWLAEGRADIYPRLGPSMEWDTAAGQAIVEEAGGTVQNWKSKKRLIYNKPDLLNPWFIARKK